jgi:hypothetical protein
MNFFDQVYLKSRSPKAVELSLQLMPFYMRIEMIFILHPGSISKLLEQMDKRDKILSFLFGVADFLAQQTEFNLPLPDVNDAFTLAMYGSLKLPMAKAKKAGKDAIHLTHNHLGLLCMKQGARAYYEFVQDKNPPSKLLGNLLLFSDDHQLQTFLEDGGDLLKLY